MKRALALIALALILVHAGKVDVRVISSNTQDNSVAYSAISAFVNMLWKQNSTWSKIITRPPQFGLTLTAPPNPQNFTGILLVFDNNATTGNPYKDREIAEAYVNNVIIPAIKAGMRVAIIASPYIGSPTTGDYIGSIVLTKLGFAPFTGKCNNVTRININQALHPIFKGVNALPGGCCLVPVVLDVIAPSSVGANGKYCVAIRVTKWSDEMIIMSWKGIFNTIAQDPNVQALMKNVLLYLAGELPAKYPKKEVIYKTVTTTTTVTHNVTQTVTTTVTQTVTNTTTVYKTLTQTVTTTITNTTTLTTTRVIIQTIISTITSTFSTTLYSTVTTTVTQTVTSFVTTTLTSVQTVTATVTTTLIRTFYSTVTTTLVKETTNYVMAAAALIIGLIIAFAVTAAMGRGGGKSESTSVEW
ncbi:hypothetical protein IPA_01740 [Ignicoccus pacificus DSM 13166]|uniref:Uncharacterized protein n=1 Tax=Ignicoccus pacificus DSM 13166 TaxID=940294 RepID=A0A977PKK4_9CREN|nr:hypothetical protein IPA_01740 [Ignicoccus pacificus DSM 13166]